MPQNFSPIQNHIITRLKNAKSRRYSELHPQGTPNDLFNYHLQFLVKKGFIEKNEDGYELSENGMKYIADAYPLNEESQAVASLFKLNVITIVSRVQNNKIEILNQVRMSNPSYGKVGVMGGIVHKGESIEGAATRKLFEETGLLAKFKILGIERRLMYVKDTLFSDVLFPIAYADSYSGELIDTEFGKNKWVPVAQAIKNETAEFDNIKKIIDVLKEIKRDAVNKMPFFYFEDVQQGSEIPR